MSFRRGAFSEATVQLERSLQEDPALSENLDAVRLRVFLALAHHNVDLADRILRSSSVVEQDPLLLYQSALFRLRFREYTMASTLMGKVLAGVPISEIPQRLTEWQVGQDFTVVPSLPVHCSGDAGRKTPGKSRINSLDLEKALSNPALAVDLWELKLTPLHLAAANLINQVWSVSGSSSTQMSTLPGSPDLLVNLLLQPSTSSILACLDVGTMTSVDTEDLRILSAMIVRLDESPQVGLSMGFRFLRVSGVSRPHHGLALEAIHVLRMGLGRLPAPRTVRSSVLGKKDLRSLQLRLALYKQLSKAYQLLGRSSDEYFLMSISSLIESYMAHDSEFPSSKLQDIANGQIHQREGIILLKILSTADNEREHFQSALASYDQTAELLEGQSFFRRLYYYE